MGLHGGCDLFTVCFGVTDRLKLLMDLFLNIRIRKSWWGDGYINVTESSYNVYMDWKYPTIYAVISEFKIRLKGWL